MYIMLRKTRYFESVKWKVPSVADGPHHCPGTIPKRCFHTKYLHLVEPASMVTRLIVLDKIREVLFFVAKLRYDVFLNP